MDSRYTSLVINSDANPGPRDEDIVKLGWEIAFRTATTNYLPTAGGKLGLFVNKVSSLSLVKSSVDSMTTCLNLAGSYARQDLQQKHGVFISHESLGNFCNGCTGVTLIVAALKLM